MSAPTVVSMHTKLLEASVRETMVDDVTQVVQRVPYIERYPARLWDAGLVSELAEAADRLSAKVAELQGAQGASR